MTCVDQCVFVCVSLGPLVRSFIFNTIMFNVGYSCVHWIILYPLAIGWGVGHDVSSYRGRGKVFSPVRVKYRGLKSVKLICTEVVDVVNESGGM